MSKTTQSAQENSQECRPRELGEFPSAVRSTCHGEAESLGRNQLVPQAKLDQIGRGRQPEMLHNPGFMILRGPCGDVERLGDFFGRPALREQLNYLALTRCEV